MSVERVTLVRHQDADTTEYLDVLHISDQLLAHLNTPEASARIAVANVPRASSSQVQDSFRPYAEELGVRSDAKGLFATSQNPGLRPDYFRPVGDSGILIEVERGKTIINNMDLLALWKGHVCDKADYLFLMVPKLLIQNDEGTRPTAPYKAAVKRMASFFIPGHETNVRALHVFGY